MLVANRQNLCNLALETTGAAVPEDGDNDSREQQLCDLYYDLVVALVHEKVWWPHAQRLVALTTPSSERTSETYEAGQPLPGFNYLYPLPSDFHRAWYLTGGGSYQISAEGINTSQRNTTLTYSTITEDPSVWPTVQYEATMKLLASRLVFPLQGDDQLKQTLQAEAEYELRSAQANILNQMTQDFSVDAPWIAARRDPYHPRGLVFSQPPAFGPIPLPAQPWQAYPRGDRGDL